MKLNSVFSVFIYLLLPLIFLSSCSPFGNSSLIESISKSVAEIFENKPSTSKLTSSGGQIISNGAGYRMNVGVSNSTSRAKTTCNSQGYCMELAISR